MRSLLALLGAIVIGGGIGFLLGRTGSERAADLAAPPTEERADRRESPADLASLRLVPPLSFTGATFSDGDETREVASVTLYTWSGAGHLPTASQMGDKTTWSGFETTALVRLGNTSTWAAGSISGIVDVKAVAFVVATYAAGSPNATTDVINFTQTSAPATESLGLAESRLVRSGLQNRVLGGLTDSTGPLGLFILVDSNVP